MTLPHARQVTVDDKVYSYIVKGPKKGQDGHGCVSLTVDLGGNRYLQASFLAKDWDSTLSERGEQDLRRGFTPQDVRTCIESIGENHQIPGDFELPNWQLLKLGS